jgi:hypothetical protein
MTFFVESLIAVLPEAGKQWYLPNEYQPIPGSSTNQFYLHLRYSDLHPV